ncbi:MAG: peptidoglycan D,D-transpeptidase FtsI family protein [Candidatus Limnocylindria bacterium]
MTRNIRRLATYLLVAFFVVSAGLAYWQVVEADALSAREDNPEVISLRRNALRGNIFDASGELLAWSERAEGFSRRVYADQTFTHAIGYASLALGTTGIERAYDGFLTGQADPNPVRQVVDEVLQREPQPNDLRLTIDRRLQDFAAAQLGGQSGSVVALDPRTGAVLALVSSPTFDANPLSDEPEPATAALRVIEQQPEAPLVNRAVDGRYVPGSIMKIVTAAGAIEVGVLRPDTTFEDQPREEVEGLVVQGFTITEHDLGGIQPQLWAFSEALQVSSNIYFAHVGLEVGPERYLERARRFGFCESLRVGPSDHPIAVAPSQVTPPAEDGTACRPFADQVELASAAFGQAAVQATPMQFALVAATIANDGLMPEPYLVADVLAHSSDGAPSTQVLDRHGVGGGRRVVSPQTAAIVRSAMVDAVEAELGALFAGAAAVDLYGITGVETAGKTGTAQRGENLPPHSWFIGFAPAGADEQPAIAVAVIVEGAGSGATQAAPIGGQVMAEWLRVAGHPGG